MAELPLLLLHPFPFDRRVFDPLDIRLSGLTLLTPDLRGSGQPSLDEFADQVIGILDAHGADRAVVGGVSMGGYVALTVLRRYPDRLAGLVLIDTKATADPEPALANRAAMAARADQGIRPDPAELLAGMLSPYTFDHRPDVVARLTVIIDEQPASTIAWNQRAMAGRPDTTAELAGAQLPVLVVVGKDDTITPPPAARLMADTAPAATLVEVPDTGHLAVAEDPQAVSAAIRDWWPAVG